MDNFELIAFIIGILYFLFGSGKKNKERTKPRIPEPKREEPEFSLEDMLKELSGQSEPAPEPFDVEEEPYLEYAEEAKFADPIEHHADTGRSLEEIKKEIRAEKGLDAEESAVEFDLRQAIINDAILRRPYE